MSLRALVRRTDPRDVMSSDTVSKECPHPKPGPRRVTVIALLAALLATAVTAAGCGDDGSGAAARAGYTSPQSESELSPSEQNREQRRREAEERERRMREAEENKAQQEPPENPRGPQPANESNAEPDADRGARGRPAICPNYFDKRLSVPHTDCDPGRCKTAAVKFWVNKTAADSLSGGKTLAVFAAAFNVESIKQVVVMAEHCAIDNKIKKDAALALKGVPGGKFVMTIRKVSDAELWTMSLPAAGSSSTSSRRVPCGTWIVSFNPTNPQAGITGKLDSRPC